jgi:hypothetical protein
MLTMSRGAFAMLAFSLLLPAIGAAQLERVGPEFQVNSATTSVDSNGYGPRLGVAADDSFVVTWQDDEDDHVEARIFDSSGAPIGLELQVAPVSSYRPELAVLPNREFVVAWEAPDGGYYGIVGRRFSSSGAAVGNQMQINSYTTEDQNYAHAAVDGAGNVFIAWESRFQDGTTRGIFAQTFDSAGATIGSEFMVNGYTLGSQALSTVAGDPTGGFVVAWSDYRYDGNNSALLARRYDSAGSLEGSEFQVNEFTSCNVAGPAFDFGPGGGMVATFGCSGRDGDTSGIFARRFDSAGASIGGDFQVATQTIDRQIDSDVAHDENDGFVIVWGSDREDNFMDVIGQRYDSTGTPEGGEFRVSTYTFFNQAYPEIGALDDGQFVVVWGSSHQDGYFAGVFGQRLAPAATALGGKKILIKTPPSGPAKNKVVVLSKDASIATPGDLAGDPRCSPLGSGSGGRLRVQGPGGDFTIDLPCAGWTADAERTKFTYRDATGATCKIVKLKQGKLLKAVCAGAQVAYTLGAAQDEVRASLVTGDSGAPSAHCMLFSAGTAADIASDGTNGRTYKALGAGAPSFCP